LTSDGKKTGKAQPVTDVDIESSVDSADSEMPVEEDAVEEKSDPEASENGGEKQDIAVENQPEWLRRIDAELDEKDELRDTDKIHKKKSKKASKSELADHLARKNEMLQMLRERLIETDKILKLKEDRLIRLAAEFENYKKRTRREWDLLKNQANAGLITDILGILDDLDRAFEHSGDSIEHFRDGISLIHSSLLDMLKRSGLSEIEAAGMPFDPQYHEAVAEMQSEDVESGIIAEVIQKGYLLNDQVIRPARVIVSRGSGE
jgi:molecular chaperone GrpE